MGVHEFTLSALVNLDGGRVDEAFLQAIGRAIQDCEDRPHVDKCRSVEIKVEVTPISERGLVEECQIQFKFADKAPVRESKKYGMTIRNRRAGSGARQKVLVFNDLSEDDPNQRTLDMQTGAEDSFDHTTDE